MRDVMLTLHYPTGMKGIPVATTTDTGVLHHFKQAVLAEWQQRIDNSDDEAEAMLNRLEYQRLRTALALFIPDGEDEANKN